MTLFEKMAFEVAFKKACQAPIELTDGDFLALAAGDDGQGEAHRQWAEDRLSKALQAADRQAAAAQRKAAPVVSQAVLHQTLDEKFAAYTEGLAAGFIEVLKEFKEKVVRQGLQQRDERIKALEARVLELEAQRAAREEPVDA